MQAGIAGTGIQKPLMLVELLDHPAKEVRASVNTVLSPRTLSVHSVESLSSLGGVGGHSASAAFTGRCATPRLITPTVVGEQPISLAMALFE